MRGTLLVFAVTFIALALGHSIKNEREIGQISNFQVTEATKNSIKLSWDISESEYDLMKCKITRDGFWDNDILCNSPTHCEYVETPLDPCMKYTFDITCFFNVDSKPSPTNTENLEGTTDGDAPGVVDNIVSDGSVVSWDSEDCAHEYIVCSHIRGSTNPEICQTISETTIDLGEMEKCSMYDIRVKAVNAGGQNGPSTFITIETETGLPGAVTNVEVEAIGQDTIVVSFDDPIINPMCAIGFSLSVGETHEIYTVKRDRPSYLDLYSTHYLNASNLEGCTNYTISVYSLSQDDEFSDPVTLYAQTDETAAKPPLNIEVVVNEDGSYTINWVTDPTDKCASDFEFCFIDTSTTIEDCVSAGGGDNTIDYGPVEACKSYQVVIVPESPSGIAGEPVYVTTPPIDAIPSALNNFKVWPISSTEIDVSWDDPDENAECISGYLTEITNLNDINKKSPDYYLTHVETFQNLDPCSTYEITILSKTLNDQLGPESIGQATTLEDVPEPPTHFEVEDAHSTSTSLYLKWWRPTTSFYCVSKYIIRYSSANNNGETEVLTDGSVFEVRYYLEDLAPNTEYTLDLVAVTPTGQETSAATAVGTTLEE